MFPSAVNTATEWIRPRSLRHEFDNLRLALLDLHAAWRRGENETGIGFRVSTICEWDDPETVRVVCRGNFQLNLRSLFHANR